MPVVDVDPDELRRLTGHDEKGDEELREDLFALGLEYEGQSEDGEFQLEFAPDRLDRLSVEGVARSLRYQYGDDRGVYVPTTNSAEWVVEVDESVPQERPYVTAAIVRGLDMSETKLESLIQLQEKLHATMGRKRVKGAIGVHDLAMLKGRAARGTAEDASGEEREADRREASDVRTASGASREERSDDPRAREGSRHAKTITYRGVEPDGDRFVPLEADTDMTPAEVLTDHPTGRTYAPIVEDYERYPAIYDEIGLFSFPPVINGKRTEVDEGSRDLLIEMTGTDQWTVDRMLNIVCYALDARGGRVEEVEVRYPDREVLRPDLSTDRKSVSHERIESMLGISLDTDEVVDLFERSGLDASTTEVGDGVDEQRSSARRTESDGEVAYEVDVPPYRVDVLHVLDLIDDVGRAYGFNDLEPRYPDVSTVGGRHERSRLEDAARDALIGLGFEDLLDFHMISEAENYERMNVEPGSGVFGADEPVTITEPYSEDYTMLRTWALPSLAMVLERNTHRAYPQDLAEIGLAAHRDDAENTRVAEARHVAAALARTDASYEDAKSRLAALCRAFGVGLETPATDHPSFIPGRVAEVVIGGDSVGVVGELHPEVLVEHDLEVPVAAFEFRLDALSGG